MATAQGPVSPELEQMTFQALLRIREADGCVSNEDVHRAATTLMCSERRIRRILARNYVNRPDPWQPDPELARWLKGQTGSIPQIHADLRRVGRYPLVSLRTLQRYLAAQYRQAPSRANRVEADFR
ncbi:hypothetical protein ACI797_04150 [Geodermatophilus sp. SYSU D00691]